MWKKHQKARQREKSMRKERKLRSRSSHLLLLLEMHFCFSTHNLFSLPYNTRARELSVELLFDGSPRCLFVDVKETVDRSRCCCRCCCCCRRLAVIVCVKLINSMQHCELLCEMENLCFFLAMDHRPHRIRFEIHLPRTSIVKKLRECS